MFLLPNDQHMAALVSSVKILSGLFWGPSRQNCHEILAGTYFQPFTALKSLLEYKPSDVLDRIESGLKNFNDADSLFQYLEPDYVRLFISHRGGIPAPLYESCYVGVKAGDTASLMGEPAIRMKERFESRGLSLDSNITEPPDHLAIELEYLYFLLEKGWSDPDPELIAEASSFASGSMLPWVTRLQERLVAAETEGSFYVMVTHVLRAVVQYIGGKMP